MHMHAHTHTLIKTMLTDRHWDTPHFPQPHPAHHQCWIGRLPTHFECPGSIKNGTVLVHIGLGKNWMTTSVYKWVKTEWSGVCAWNIYVRKQQLVTIYEPRWMSAVCLPWSDTVVVTGPSLHLREHNSGTVAILGTWGPKPLLFAEHHQRFFSSPPPILSI